MPCVDPGNRHWMHPGFRRWFLSHFRRGFRQNHTQNQSKTTYFDFPYSPHALSCIDEEALITQGFNCAVSMADTSSRGRLWIRHLWLIESTWIVRTYHVAWERSKVTLRQEAFRASHFQICLDNSWKAYDVEVSDFLVHVDYYHDHS